MHTPNATPARGDITPNTTFTPIPAPDAITTVPPAARHDDNLMNHPPSPK